MKGKDFFKKIEDDDRFSWLGCHAEQKPEDDYVVVCCRPNGLRWRIKVAGVLESTWKELEGVLTGERQPRSMTHIARIVGYYSFTYAWNKSKLAELLDRGKGSYGLPEPESGETPKTKTKLKTKRKSKKEVDAD